MHFPVTCIVVVPLVSVVYVAAAIPAPSSQIGAAQTCAFNLTQPAFQLGSEWPGGASWYTVPQGSGWIQGDWVEPAFVDTSTATLTVALNPSAPNDATVGLAVLIEKAGRLFLTTHINVSRGGSPVSADIDVSGLPDGEFTTLIRPDATSVARGWCGGLVRYLRKSTTARSERDVASAPVLPVDAPLLFVDDYWIANRSEGVRRVLHQATQLRVSNDSFATLRPHPWIAADRGLELQGSDILQLGVRVNYGSAVSPLHDPNSLPFDCTANISRDDSAWSCVARSSPDARVPTTARGSMRVMPTGAVRWYDSAVDGPVNVSQVGIFFTYGTNHSHYPTTIGNVSFPALSATPVWDRTLSDGSKETLALPVNGARVPLTYCDSRTLQPPYGVGSDSCASLVAGRPGGPLTSDPRCANDNFGGSSFSFGPPQVFRWVQGRRIPAFSPRVAPFDNLATIRRILISWETNDGLNWEPHWWGMPTPQDGIVSEQYGASVVCASSGRDVSQSCASVSDDAGAAPPLLLALVYPFDAGKQQFWMDLASSRTGASFNRVQQDLLPGEAPEVFVPNGDMGTSWNGGLIMGLDGSGLQAGSGGRESYALLPFVQSGAHFAFGVRELSNLSTAAVQEWGEQQFFGPRIQEWEYWNSSRGWDGVADMARQFRIEVGVLRWRTHGWVSMTSSANGSGSVATRQFSLPQACEGKKCLLSLNARASAMRVSLVDTNGSPLPGYSGPDAAKFSGDEVSFQLTWRDGPELPNVVDAIACWIEMDPKDELFALTVQLALPS